MRFCKATTASKLGHDTVGANVNDRPTNAADLTPNTYLVYTKAKQKELKVTEIKKVWECAFLQGNSCLGTWSQHK